MTVPITLVSDLEPRTTFACDGIEKVFPVGWPARTSSDLYIAYEDGTDPELEYSFTGLNNDEGFTITFVEAPADGRTLVVERRMAIDRTVEYGQQRRFNAATVNAADADMVMRQQEVRRDVRRAMVRHTGDPATGQARLPIPSSGYYLRWDENGNLYNSTVEVPDVTPPDSHVTTKYLDDIVGLDFSTNADNGPLLSEFLDDLNAGGGGKLVGDGRAFSLFTSVGVPSFVTVESLKLRLGPTASFAVAGRKKIAFAGLTLLADADAGDAVLELDTSPVGGGAISDYAYVGMPLSISDSPSSESCTITGIDDGARAVTLSEQLIYSYSAATATVSLEVSALLASNNTLLSDQITVDAAHVARLGPYDWGALEDNRRTGGATTWMEIRQIIGVEDAGDNIISLSGQTQRNYLTSQAARFTVYEMARRAAIIGCSVEFISAVNTTRYDPAFEIRYALDSVIMDCEVPGTDSVGRRGNMFRLHKSANSHIIRPTGRNPVFTDEGEGNGVVVAYSTRCSVQDPVLQSCRHGVQFIASTESYCSNPSVSDSLLTALDFHGMNSVGCFYTDVHSIAFASRTASSSNGVLAIGNGSWLDGDHRCGILGGNLGPFQGNSGVYGVRVFPPSTKPVIKGLHANNMQKLVIHRDIAGSGTLKVTDLEIIDCSVQDCGDRVIDLQGKASGASVDTLERCRISGLRGAGLYRGILAYDVNGLIIEDSRLEFENADDTTERYAFNFKNITGLVVADSKSYDSDRGIDLEDCPDARFLKVDLMGLGDDELLKDQGGCDGTEFRGCNAFLADGSAATGIDNSGGSVIVYKAVGNIGTETTTAYEFATTDKLLARVSSGGGAGEEVDFTDTAQSISAAASAVAVADLIHTASSDIASATTTDLATATGMTVTITGTTTITGFGTVAAGRWRVLTFSGSLTLTHDGTALDLPGNANIQTAAGDVAFMVSKGSGNWKCASYVRDVGSLATQIASAVAVTGGSITGITDITIADGGTGASTAGAAFDNLHTKSSDIASAGTTDLSTATGFFVDITGTTTITALGTEAAGVLRLLRFNGALTFTHNGTSLILPGGSNITTASGDRALVVSLGSGNWLCVDYVRASGLGPLDATALRTAIGIHDAILAIPFDGGGATIAAGYKIALPVPRNLTVTGWRLVSLSGAGSMVLDIWLDTFANYPPVVGDTVTGSEKPTLSAAETAEDTSLSTWTDVSWDVGDWFIVNVDSCSGIQQATLELLGTWRT